MGDLLKDPRKKRAAIMVAVIAAGGIALLLLRKPSKTETATETEPAASTASTLAIPSGESYGAASTGDELAGIESQLTGQLTADQAANESQISQLHGQLEGLSNQLAQHSETSSTAANAGGAPIAEGGAGVQNTTAQTGGMNAQKSTKTASQSGGKAVVAKAAAGPPKSTIDTKQSVAEVEKWNKANPNHKRYPDTAYNRAHPKHKRY